MTNLNSAPIRRKFPRKAFRKAIGYVHGGRSEVVEGVEIGEGGISFKSKNKLQMDQKMIVSFFLPDGDFFSLRTTLRNIQSASGVSNSAATDVSGDEQIYGLSFEEVSIALKRQIRAYVARNSTTSELLRS